MTSHTKQFILARRLSADHGDEPAVGGILRVDDSDIDDPDGLTSPTLFSYTWYANGRIADGANNQVFEIKAGSEGQAILVRVQFDDAMGITEALYSNIVWVHDHPDATGAPVIMGDPRIGETLSIDLSGISDPRRVDTGSFSYQWRRRDYLSNTQDIAGATAARYELTPFDYGKLVGVVVDFRDHRGSPESLESEYTGAVVPSRTSALTSIAVEGFQSKPDGSYMVALGARVQLIAIPAKGDADGGESSYEWTATSGEIENPTSMLATWTPAEPGTHEVSVTVHGPAGSETTTSIVVEAANPVPALPLAWLLVLAVLLIRRGSRTR